MGVGEDVAPVAVGGAAAAGGLGRLEDDALAVGADEGCLDGDVGVVEVDVGPLEGEVEALNSKTKRLNDCSRYTRVCLLLVNMVDMDTEDP